MTGLFPPAAIHYIPVRSACSFAQSRVSSQHRGTRQPPIRILLISRALGQCRLPPANLPLGQLALIHRFCSAGRQFYGISFFTVPFDGNIATIHRVFKDLQRSYSSSIHIVLRFLRDVSSVLYRTPLITFYSRLAYFKRNRRDNYLL